MARNFKRERREGEQRREGERLVWFCRRQRRTRTTARSSSPLQELVACASAVAVAADRRLAVLVAAPPCLAAAPPVSPPRLRRCLTQRNYTMADMVFGNPITEETLKGMPEYRNKTTITRTDKARMALIMKNVADAQAFKYMESLKMEGSGCSGVATLGKIYNATGGTIKYSVKHDFSGKLASQSTYSVKIQNGQCIVFKHEETSGKDSGSRGAVVYWGKNKHEKDCDWMFSWSSPTNKDNKVFTEIAEHGHYKANSNDPIWDHVDEELSNCGTTSECEWEGCDSSMTSTPSNNVKTRVVVDATAKLA